MPETTTTTQQSSTTVKLTPCELPRKSKERSEDKLEEKSPENKESSTTTPSTTTSTTTSTTSTKKPVKWIRQRRSAGNIVSSGNKRCIGDFFNSPLFRGFNLGGATLGASNPNAVESPKESIRYARSIPISQNDPSKKVEDSLTDESFLQGVQMKQQRSIMFPFGEDQSQFLSKIGLPLKTENLLHGNIISSLESNELHNSRDSRQTDSNSQAVKPATGANPSSNIAPVYRPEDYLPSYEYFPKNSQPSLNTPQYYPQSSPQSSHSRPQTYYVGPSPYMTTPLVGKAFLRDIAQVEDIESSLQYSSKTSDVTRKTSQVALPAAPSGCRCDPEQFNDLLHHMQSSYQQFHNGMIQLFDTFKSQSNCGGSNAVQGSSDSSSSPTHSIYDHQIGCSDKNYVEENPELIKKCKGDFDDAYVNPSSGYYQPPGENIKTGGFKNQFLSFADYTKMMNVNANSGTLMSSSFDMDTQGNGSPQTAHNDSRDQTMKQLKQHINQFRETPDIPEAESIPIDSNSEVPQEIVTPKFPKFDMKALLGNLRLKN